MTTTIQATAKRYKLQMLLATLLVAFGVRRRAGRGLVAPRLTHRGPRPSCAEQVVEERADLVAQVGLVLRAQRAGRPVGGEDAAPRHAPRAGFVQQRDLPPPAVGEPAHADLDVVVAGVVRQAVAHAPGS